MRVSDTTIVKLLGALGKASNEQLAVLMTEANNEKISLQEYVIKKGLTTDKELTQAYANYAGIRFIEINVSELDTGILKLIPERIARKYNAVVVGIEQNGHKILAMEDPDDVQAIDFLQKELGSDVDVCIATTQDILAALDQYRGNIGSELSKVITEQDTTSTEQVEENVNEADIAEDSPIAQTVNLILEYAIKGSASDIHIEPREDHVIVRYRIDGILHETQKIPKKLQAALISRIKILANLKIDERRAPQDGRFKIQIGSRRVGFRVSTLPIVDGEKVAMRILNETSHAPSLKELGYWGDALNDIQKAIQQPHGMILVTGPTGSGKSTSLFSILSMLNKPDVNISTIEDPVEYRVFGANQTQVNPKAGMTFAAGLRALLRQDPNIIMVGEIRDGETASLGVQAALTGHLVLSTLHTNNAATCLPRLLDMGIEPFLIASTVRAVVGQRLVRQLCPDCRIPYMPDMHTIQQIVSVFHYNDKTIMQRIHYLEQLAIQEELGKNENAPATDPRLNNLGTTEYGIVQLWKTSEKGCETCNFTGYHGRLGIYEVLNNTEVIQKLIVDNATSERIQIEAINAGMVTMQLDGFIKALRGQTTIEEVLRVTTEK